jgi:hypothetical protein
MCYVYVAMLIFLQNDRNILPVHGGMDDELNINSKPCGEHVEL